MAIKLENMEFEVSSQSTVTSNKNWDLSGSSSVLLPANSIKGSYSSLSNQYATIAVGTQGATNVNVFSASTAPVAGTVTAFWTIGGISSSNSSGTVTLWATTAGTIATITSGSITGAFVGTSVLSAAIASGDTVKINGVGAGTCTAVIVFQTAN